MDVLTSETCWALNKVIIKQVASSWSLSTQRSFLHSHVLVGVTKTQTELCFKITDLFNRIRGIDNWPDLKCFIHISVLVGKCLMECHVVCIVADEFQEHYINNCPTRCNKKQSISYSASSPYMFRVSNTPIIRSTQNCNYSYLPPSWSIWPRWREVAAKKVWPVPEAVVTVLCTRDDGCGWHLKHVKWTCRIINRLLCVAPRWTIINIDQRCTEP